MIRYTLLHLFRHDITNGGNAPYMLRWVLQTRWFSIRIHKILASDQERDLHDHPWNFTSVMLSGFYAEVSPEYPNGRIYSAPCIIRRRADYPHRLILCAPVWTLVFSGPKIRDWGFLTEKGWIPWQRYEHEIKSENHKPWDL